MRTRRKEQADSDLRARLGLQEPQNVTGSMGRGGLRVKIREKVSRKSKRKQMFSFHPPV